MPDMCALSNPYDLHSQYYPIPTGSMGSWEKVPDHYFSIPRAGSGRLWTGGPIQDSTILQLIRLNIIEKIIPISPTSIQLTGEDTEELLFLSPPLLS